MDKPTIQAIIEAAESSRDVLAYDGHTMRGDYFNVNKFIRSLESLLTDKSEPISQVSSGWIPTDKSEIEGHACTTGDACNLCKSE